MLYIYLSLVFACLSKHVGNFRILPIDPYANTGIELEIENFERAKKVHDSSPPPPPSSYTPSPRSVASLPRFAPSLCPPPPP